MTEEEKVFAWDTLTHIERVRECLDVACDDIRKRGHVHDASKLREPELGYFAKASDLKRLTYDSPEYKASLANLKPALDHHYANNRHHPEHFKNGVNDMTLMDLLEMLCDWKASSERQLDGNLKMSLDKGASRFKIEHQLARILENTANYLGM